MRRRSFLRAFAAASVSSAAFRAWCAAHGADFDFASASSACGWDPAAKDAFYFLHASDLHMTENPDWDRGALQMKDKFMGRCFIDEINAMNSLPAKPSMLFLTGDLTSHVTMDQRTWPRAEKKWAHYRKYVTDRLAVPWRQFIGNNDCASVPYLKVFEDQPLYWSVEKGGICFVGLHGYDKWRPENTNHAGILYGAEQLAWLRGVVEKTSARTLVVLTHEPLKDGDSHCARAQLAPILDLFRGEEVWNVCGHNHANINALIKIGRRDVRSVETMTPVGQGFVIGDGGFRVFFCREGKICGTSLRWLTPAGEPIGYAPDRVALSPRRMRLLEESLPPDALASALVGRDPFNIAGSEKVQDRIADYYISRPGRDGRFGRLVWTVPRRVAGRKVSTVQIMCGSIAGHVGVSADGREWRLNPVDWSRGGARRVIEVPDGLEGEKMWLSLSNESRHECKFFGYSLLG
jgi:hypothetical protein